MATSFPKGLNLAGHVPTFWGESQTSRLLVPNRTTTSLLIGIPGVTYKQRSNRWTLSSETFIIRRPNFFSRIPNKKIMYVHETRSRYETRHIDEVFVILHDMNASIGCQGARLEPHAL